MQVLDTAIHADPKGATVEFLGEGGEKIAVTMIVSDPLLGDAALVDRAREMMVQCATFGPTERDGPVSNGDTARPGVDSQSDTRQDLYTFEYREGGSVRRVEGVELPNLEAVHDEALRSAIDLLDDTAAEPRQDGWAVRVRGGDGEVVLSVDFDDARREKAAAAM